MTRYCNYVLFTNVSTGHLQKLLDDCSFQFFLERIPKNFEECIMSIHY